MCGATRHLRELVKAAVELSADMLSKLESFVLAYQPRRFCRKLLNLRLWAFIMQQDLPVKGAESKRKGGSGPQLASIEVYFCQLKSE